MKTTTVKLYEEIEQDKHEIIYFIFEYVTIGLHLGVLLNSLCVCHSTICGYWLVGLLFEIRHSP